MIKNVARKVVLIAVILVLGLSAVMAYQASTGSETAYNIPRMLGVEGEGGESMQLAAGAPAKGAQGPFFETQAAAVSMNRDLRDLPQTGPDQKRPMKEMGKLPIVDKSGAPDPVIQTSDHVGNLPLGPLAVAPAPIISFPGLDFNNWGAGWPPDTHGDVGPSHYIQVVNTSIGIFDKSTGTRLAAFTFDTFFSGNGASDVCGTSNQGDPIALYDQVSGRWIITDFAWGNIQNGPYYECIAVSKTADPLSGGWYLYSFRADDDAHAFLNDYPKLGLWGDGIYMSSNLFDCLDSYCGSASYNGVRVWALNRDDMIAGAALRSVSFILGTDYYSLLPANVKGTLPPASTPEYFMSDNYPLSGNTISSMNMWKFSTDWATPANSTLTGPTTIAVAPFTLALKTVPQKNSTEKLDTLGDRLMSWLQYRNISGTESLWASHTVTAGTSMGVRWMEVRNMGTTPSIYQQGTYAPDTKYRWMPSLAVSGTGDMAIGYSVSTSTMFPGIRYAGRLAGDPLNTLGQTEQTLIAGTGSQKGGYSRWGDYSSMAVDPVDDCTFWYTTEYYAAVGHNWQTRIGSFQLPGCGSTGPGNIHVGDLDATKRLLTTSWTSTVTITVHDSSHNPLAGVTVNVLWSGAYSHSASCVTNTKGQCKLTTGSMKKSNTTVTLTITSLTGPFTYDPLANHDPDTDSNGTVITITR